MPNKRRRKTADGPLTQPTPLEQAVPAASDPEFFEQLQKLTAEDWQAGHKVYVYRTWPIIDRRDDHHYIGKLSEPIDEEFLLRHYGSGKYYLRLNNSHGESINSKTVSAHDTERPPKVSPDEVVQSDPRNERYFKVWPLVPHSDAPTTADNAAVHELSKLATRIIERQESTTASDGREDPLKTLLVKWALEQTSKERDSNDPTRIATLLKELKALLPPQQQASDDLTTIDRVLSIIEKLNPRTAAPEAPDPIGYIEKILGVAEKLRPAQVEQPASGVDGGTLASIAAIVHEVAGVLKDPVTIATQVWAAGKARAAAGAANGAAAPTQAAATEATTGQPAPNPPGGVPQSVINLASSITPVMLRWIHDDVPGEELGSNFAGWVADGFGVQELKSLQAFGVDGIVDLYRHSPFWAHLATMEDKFRQFVAAFVKWEPSPEDGEEQADDPDAPERIEV